jgi:DHA2 family multidrug resistance protein-like MFS transporter
MPSTPARGIPHGSNDAADGDMHRDGTRKEENDMASTIPERARRREWLGLAVLALPCVLYSMDLTVLNLALPRIVADLAPTSSELLWIVDVYGFVLAGSLITMGTLGDRIGRRRFLLTGAAAFGAASVLAAFSTSACMLIVARALLGVAGATLAPSTLALIHTMFRDPRQRMSAMGVWAASFSAGGALGPLLGGLVLQRFHWGSVFLLAVPVMALLLATGRTLLPEVKAPVASRLDLTSAALSLGTVLLAILGVKELARGGSAWLPAMPAAAILGALFVRRQRGLAEPLVDLRMFRVPVFSTALATYVLGVFVVFGIYVFLAQQLQLVLGLSPLRAGYWMLPSSAGFIVGSMLAPLAARRVRPFAVIAGGLVLASGGLVIISQFAGLTGIAVGSVLYSLGLAPVPTLATAIIVGLAPPERVGAASALAETGSELGGALGIALFGSLGTAVYRHALGSGFPVQADSLAGAVAFAARLPGARATAMREASRAAFERAFALNAAVGAAILLATAVLVLLVLSRTGEGDAPRGATSDTLPNASGMAGFCRAKRSGSLPGRHRSGFRASSSPDALFAPARRHARDLTVSDRSASRGTRAPTASKP